MAIPKFDELFNDILDLLSDKQEYKTRDVKEILSNKLDLTDEERQQLLPSGREPIIKNRIGWSLSALKKAGYVESQKWGSVNITEFGLNEYKSTHNITIDDLMKIPSYQEYVNGSSSEVIDDGESTPEEEIEASFTQINKKLAGELLENILNNKNNYYLRFGVQQRIDSDQVFYLKLRNTFETEDNEQLIETYTVERGNGIVYFENTISPNNTYN